MFSQKVSIILTMVLLVCFLNNGCSVEKDSLTFSSDRTEASIGPDATQIVTDTEIIRDKLEKAFDSFVGYSIFSGSVLVADEGKVLFSKAYGMADYTDNRVNTTDTVFRLGSITKQFTATAILMLQEKGLLNVDNTVDMYIKGYPNGRNITIHNLLTHTSGIAEHTTPDLFAHADHYYSPEGIINLFKNLPANFDPGEAFNYCNSNYILLGYIIEKISGKKYKDFINENIFDPLGMSSSGYGDNNFEGKLDAVGYEDSYESRAAYIDMSVPYAAGALVSSVKDLYKWDTALYTDKILTKSSREKMFTPYLSNYAYGWFIREKKSGGVKCMITEHSGQVNGFSSYILRNTTKKVLVVILCNRENQRLQGIADIMDDIATGV